jgi:hypothetical protein
MTREEIDRRFAYHKADEDVGAKIQASRDAVNELAHSINENLPECREKSLAITHLEETMFWASAALARPAAKGTHHG